MVEDLTGEEAKDEGHEPRECMPCGGSGQVISNLGGSAHRVSCPWCSGSGRRQPGIDAQAAWLADGPDGARADAQSIGDGEAAPDKSS